MAKLLEEIELTKLASLPHILVKLLRACHEDSVCFDTLSDIISKDASLSARVISVANSPAYGKASKLTSLRQALLYLGLDTIKSIAITASVQQFFSRYSREKNRFLKKFWEHTLLTAVIAKSLARLTSYHSSEEAYIAGLLHDIGQLIFESHSQHEYSEIVSQNSDSNSLIESEMDKYQVTHAEIGAHLLDMWRVPAVISEAVRYHHASVENLQDAGHLVKIVNLANTLTLNADSDILANYEYRLFDLTDSVLQQILNDARDEVKRVATSLEIDIGGEQGDDAAKDEAKQIELAKKIRDISLAQNAIIRPPVETQSPDYRAIYTSAHVLFGLNKTCLFLFDEERRILSSETSSQIIEDYFPEGISLGVDNASLIAISTHTDCCVSSFDVAQNNELTVIDRQLMSAMKSEGLFCLPFNSGEVCYGVLAIGVSRQQNGMLSEKHELLSLYAAQSAKYIATIVNNHEVVEKSLKDSRQQLHARAREVIHEVNNPLSIIRNYLHLLGKRLEEKDPAQNDLRVIRDEINRVGDIVLKCADGFSDAVKSGQLQKVNINDLLLAMNKVFASSLYASNDVISKTQFDDSLQPVYLNKNSFNQIITNLVKNAVEAMKDKKEISLTTRSVNINGKNFIEVEVADTGPGIPVHVLSNIYKPVESTKGKQNSGLGLSIVKNLLDEMGGAITCKTGSGGTVFSLHIPIGASGK